MGGMEHLRQSKASLGRGARKEDSMSTLKTIWRKKSGSEGPVSERAHHECRQPLHQLHSVFVKKGPISVACDLE